MPMASAMSPQHHGAHELVAVIEKPGLLFDDGLGDLQQRFVANREAANEPPGLLQLRPQYAEPFVSTQRARIDLIDAQ